MASKPESLDTFLMNLFRGLYDESDESEEDLGSVYVKNNNHDDRGNDQEKRFCLVLFHDSKLSKMLNAKRIKKQQEMNRSSVASSERRSATEEEFRKKTFKAIIDLVREFMQHQKAPSSKRYVIDLGSD